MNGWMYYGGGLPLWTELYAQFDLIPAPAGNTGVQMGGWFNKQINSLDDLKGLKMRIPGLGGEVLKRAGGTPVNLPGGELFVALQNGTIDATEWVGPYNDLAFGLYKAARYYYYPGFHEPGTTLEAIINKSAFAALPKDLQSIVVNACKVVNQDLLAEYTARNPIALETLLQKHKVELRAYPEDVVAELYKLSREVVAELANRDAFSKKVYESYNQFYQRSRSWSDISDLAYLQARVQGPDA
jgi:TRAP-type mannitol/chloroaromatic compound transport system substrate-binding protein